MKKPTSVPPRGDKRYRSLPFGGARRGLFGEHGGGFIFYGQRPHFLPLGILSFHYVWLFGTKSDVMVATGRYELVHISADATITSRLPKAVHT